MTYPKRFIRSRISTATAIGASALLALTACGGGSGAPQGGAASEFTGEYTGPKVELDYWNGFTGGDGPFMKKMVEEFNAEHENIKVVPNTIK